MIPTFRPWTQTSDDSYIYQLSLVVATATVSFCVRLFPTKTICFPKSSTCAMTMRRASEASFSFLGFPRKKKTLHNGSYEHRVPKKKKKNITVYQGCVCDSGMCDPTS